MANAAIELSRSNRASFKKKAITKYKSVDKKKLLKRAAIATGATAAAAGATYGAYKWGGMSKMDRGRALVKARRAPGRAGKAVIGAAKAAPSRMKSAKLHGVVKAKKAAMRFQGDKGHSWGDKGVAAMKATKSRQRKISATKIRHPKHWRRYVKAEDFNFTRDDLIEAILEELMSE